MLGYTKATKVLADLKAEVVKVIRGESSFSSDILNELIAAAQQKCKDCELEIASLQSELDDSRQMMAEIKTHYKNVIRWSQLFDSANIETKKMIVAYLIKKVSVRRGCEVSIEFNINFEQFNVVA